MKHVKSEQEIPSARWPLFATSIWQFEQPAPSPRDCGTNPTGHSFEANIAGDQSSQPQHPKLSRVHSMKVNEEQVYLTTDQYCETIEENVLPIPKTATNSGGPKNPSVAATPRRPEPKEASPTATDTTATNTTATKTTATDTDQARNRSKRSLFHGLRTKG